MSNSGLEQVKQLAERLSPEDRQQLFQFLANLPDSGVQSHNLEPPPAALDGAKETQAKTVDGDSILVVSTDRMARLLLKGRIIFDVFYYPENFLQSRMEICSWKDAPPSEKVIKEVRRAFALMRKTEIPTEITDDEIIAACKQPHMDLFIAETDRISRDFSARLPHITWLLFDAGMKIVELGYRNDFAEKTGQRKKTLEEITETLVPYWKHIKTHLNLSPGGRQNVKHDWSPVDYHCLYVQYQQLKPIWQEAKKTARAARRSKEPTRRNRWKEEVAAIYQEQALPADLIERLAPPGDPPPSELALIHAGRLCIPDASYSLKILKEKLTYFKKGTRTPPKTG